MHKENSNDFMEIKNLINEYSKNSDYSNALKYSKLLIEKHPFNIIGYYTTIKLMEYTNYFEIEFVEKMILSIVNFNDPIKQQKIGIETVKILNKLLIKYGLITKIFDKLERDKQIGFKILNFDLINRKIHYIQFISKNNSGVVNIDFQIQNELLNKTTENLILRKFDYIAEFVLELNNQIIVYHSNPNKNISIWCKSLEEQNIYIPLELPINFSIVHDNLYGSGAISSKYIYPLNCLGINTIINLVGEEKPKDDIIDGYKKFNINLVYYGFKDRSACTFETYLNIQEIIKTKTNGSDKCLVHCVGGIGRTNMILAGVLIRTLTLSPAEAIGMLKKSRKVIMVPEQIMILKKYYGYITNLNMDRNALNLPQNLRGLIIMCGLPCSGKSTLSLEIFKKYCSHNTIIHLNQDEIGKSGCESLLNTHAKTADLIIIDRCNPISTDRIHWINMYKGLVDKKITIIFLNLGLDLSLSRLKTRENHLTLGITGENIIKNISKQITNPLKSEGWDNMIQINSIEELNEFKEQNGLNSDYKLNPNPPNPPNPNLNLEIEKIIKFPRTKHIFNLGAMARDDLLMDKKDIDNMLGGEIIVEEKIDGANLGFRLDPSTNKIIAQNRSHYVCSSSHPQFKKLDGWIEANKSGLMKILSGGNYIIYGEWLFSKHSINYTNLPDYFIMFDLYDIGSNTFFSRDWIEKKIEGTGINLVPLIYRGKTTIDKLKTLVQSKSQFYDGVVEGVYVRSCDTKTNKLKLRAKIVRGDFISGDEHWTKGKQTLNIVAKYKN